MAKNLNFAATVLLRNRDNMRSKVVVRTTSRTVSVLTIAGSDSGGGAGIQADLKTFAAFGIHGLSAITAVTAQNLHRVVSIHCVPAIEVERQLHAVFEDFDIGAVKIGMLGSAATISVVARFLSRLRGLQIVLDPVLVSTSGRALLPARALAALRDKLIPLADVLTPNLPEASALLKRPLGSDDDLRMAAGELLNLGAKSVLLKGGHGDADPVCDYLVDRTGIQAFRHARKPIVVHGTGCVLSAAIAAGLALGHTRMDAVSSAVRYLQKVLRKAYRPGKSNVLVLPAMPAFK